MYVLTTVPLQWAKCLIIAPVVQYRRTPIPGFEPPPLWQPDFEDGAPYYSVIQFLSQKPSELLKEAAEERSDEIRKQEIFKALVRHQIHYLYHTSLSPKGMHIHSYSNAMASNAH